MDNAISYSNTIAIQLTETWVILEACPVEWCELMPLRQSDKSGLFFTVVNDSFDSYSSYELVYCWKLSSSS